jgi:hypothetical protein
MLLTLYLVRIYQLLKGESGLQCDGKLGLCHSWYVSAHLWNAQTRYDFAVAYGDKTRFLVTDADFTALLRDAEPDDVDIFGKMMLVTVLGIDLARAWFAARGCIL